MWFQSGLLVGKGKRRSVLSRRAIEDVEVLNSVCAGRTQVWSDLDLNMICINCGFMVSV